MTIEQEYALYLSDHEAWCKLAAPKITAILKAMSVSDKKLTWAGISPSLKREIRRLHAL